MKWIASLRKMVAGMRVPCEVVERELWDYLDQEIEDPTVQRRIEAHLEICQRCFPAYDYRRAFLKLLERHAEEPVPEGLRIRVFEQLLAEDGSGGV